MTIDEVIKRVNELYHLSKERALTEEEYAVVKALRAELRAKINALENA